MPAIRTVSFAAALLALAACSPAADTAAPAAATPAPAPVASEPTAPVDPAPTAPAPAPGELAAVANDPAVINFQGFGPATFGGTEESVRQSWGRPLALGTPAEGSTCTYLTSDPPLPGNGRGIAFMIEDGKFVRYDVDTPQFVAPGDLVTGMSADDVRAKFGARVEEQPHNYVEGALNLVVSPEDGGDARLAFETDASGIITRWHIGIPPQVHYVEGCG